MRRLILFLILTGLLLKGCGFGPRYEYRTFTMKDGAKYAGMVKVTSSHLVSHGEGVVTNKKGDKYFGQSAMGQPEGYGIKLYAKGTAYAGEWKDGRWNGFGTFYSSTGAKEEAVWQKGKPFKGRLTFKMFDIINPPKRITTTYDNGDKYEGWVYKGLRTGIGIYYFSNGAKYIGEFLDDKKHGFGSYIEADGKTQSTGRWANDKPLK